MQKKLKSILLIDDDEATNYYHRIIIDDAGCAEEVNVATDGKKALEFLTASFDGKHHKPDLIFLDINMPVMNGWEFLEHYHKLSEEQKAKITLVMLTTSINPDDLEHAKKYHEISGFRNKPLSVEMLQEIMNKYFI